MRTTRILLALALVACSTTAPPPEPHEPGADLPLGERVAPFAASVVRARQLPEGFDPSGLVPRLPTDPNVCELRLALFEDVVIDVEVTGLEQSATATVVRGDVMGEPGSSVTLAVVGPHLAGTVRTDSRFISILPRHGATVVVEWDEGAAPPDAPAIVRETPPTASIARAVADDIEAHPDDGEGPVIDLLVATTDVAVAGAGGTDAMRALVELAVAETNQSLLDSAVPGRFVLVGTVETTYDETDFDFDQTISRLATPGDGFMDDVPTARDEMGADQVVLLVDSVTRFAGTGFQMTAANAPYFSGFAYSVVSRDYATGYYTFAHELGHNLGAQHDPDHASAGYREDARGHRAPESGFRTVMSYACDDTYCRRLPRWSNPDGRHEGAPTGVAGLSDNARTLRETMPLVAAFRERATPVLPSPAAITSPVDGVTLGDGPVTLEWTDSGADAYYVTMGSAPGEATWGRAVVTDATQTTFDAPPAEGQPVYVRLWSQHAGVWRHTEARYTAASRAFEGAAVSLPVPGVPLTSTWLWFAWPDVEGAVEYRLRVGTDAQPGLLYDRTQIGRWAQVTGLPIDGSPVRVSLSTRGPDGWVERVTHYDGWAAPPHVSAITAPAANTELGGRTIRVSWTASETTARWLVIRDDDGLVLTEPVEGSSLDVSDLPQDGRRLYGVLYSQGPDGWTPAIVTWRAASQAR